MGGSIIGTLLTKPESDELLMKFYSSVRPWGFWKPVYEKILVINPGFKKNTDFGRDMLNVAVGIVWQLAIMALPLLLIIKNWKTGAIMAGVILITTVFLKQNWFNKLEDN